jgi:hypothetical protein
MTNLPLEHFVPGFRGLLAALLLALAACGPGSGGTGTGPIASFSSVSSSGAVAGGAPSSPDDVLQPGICVGSCGRVDLLLQSDRVEVVADCGRFVFVGLWEPDANGQVELPGTLEIPTGGDGAPASLRLQFSGQPQSSPAVTVTLSTPDGQAVLGPELLGRIGEVPPRAPGVACPS